MTKAERIFKASYYASMDHIERWGFEEGNRWSGLNTDERLSIRTLNAIDKLIDSEIKKVDHFERFTSKHPGDFAEDAASLERYQLRREALCMVRNTVAKERERIEADKAYFNRHEITEEQWLDAVFA